MTAAQLSAPSASVAAQPAKIGPNAVIQTFQAIQALRGQIAAQRVASAARCDHWLSTPPTEMVDEIPVIALFRALERVLPHDSDRIAWEAGTRTADYILTHRIPKPAQRILKILPARLAAPILLKAIAKHAWTFAGSGSVKVHGARPFRVEIEHNPLTIGLHHPEPACHWHRAVFTRLFQTLVHKRTKVRELSCGACGAKTCVFELSWT